MVTLSLLRHAKSSWDKPLDDYERPLSKRGEMAAPEMGSVIVELGRRPDLILCSGAKRTRETLQHVLEKLGTPEPAVRYDDALYMATPDTIISRVKAATTNGADTAPGHVMIVGHNPGLEELALWLVGSGADEERARLAQKFPTAGLAVISFDSGDWDGIGPGAGRLDHFVTPRRLP
jgi:phosphohistidine phosphatase